MIFEVWFECVDGSEFETLILREDAMPGNEPLVLGVLPSIGDKVGIWNKDPANPEAVMLHYVVDVVHFISRAKQEIHVKCSERR